MRFTVNQQKIRKQVVAPASKSVYQRAVLAAALADGCSTVVGNASADDCQAALRAAKGFGAQITQLSAHEVKIQGQKHPLISPIDCGESAFCARVSCAIASKLASPSAPIQISGRGSLLARPFISSINSLQAFGARLDSDGQLPITFFGGLQSAARQLIVDDTSQAISALLFALPLCTSESIIEIQHISSPEYVVLTQEVLELFGIRIFRDNQQFRIPGNQQYQPVHYTVEGDWSAAAFALVGGALSTGISIRGLTTKSQQPDRGIISLLRNAGVQIYSEGADITALPAHPAAFSCDLTNTPDLFPPLVALAVHARGISRLRGAHRLVSKESNRAKALITEFQKLGAKISRIDDELVIVGGTLSGGEVSSWEDHRIAMALAVAAVRASNPITINSADVVRKSYPDFFEIFSD